MTFDPTGGIATAIAERSGLNPPHTAYRTITAAECYDLAGKSWMPAAASEALIRAARTIEALETDLEASARYDNDEHARAARGE